VHAVFALLPSSQRGTGEGMVAALVESALNVAAEQVAVAGTTGELLGREGNRSFAAPQNVYRGEASWLRSRETSSGRPARRR
jgi:crotonobetainyl-CoA:carnitine CoA-transferase CaiB-like acyl-CoA transferase